MTTHRSLYDLLLFTGGCVGITTLLYTILYVVTESYLTLQGCEKGVLLDLRGKHVDKHLYIKYDLTK